VCDGADGAVAHGEQTAGGVRPAPLVLVGHGGRVALDDALRPAGAAVATGEQRLVPRAAVGVGGGVLRRPQRIDAAEDRIGEAVLDGLERQVLVGGAGDGGVQSYVDGVICLGAGVAGVGDGREAGPAAPRVYEHLD